MVFRILALSGSLRKTSLNSALIQAAAFLAPAKINVFPYQNLGDLPLFNLDLEGNENLPVIEFRKQIIDCDGVLIASPEYAHGVSGVIKNALDWVVSSGEFVGKRVALINTSSRAKHADKSLREILKTMNAKIIPRASLTIPLPNPIDAEKITANPTLSEMVIKALNELSLAKES